MIVGKTVWNCPTDPKCADQTSAIRRMLGKRTGEPKGSELVCLLSYLSSLVDFKPTDRQILPLATAHNYAMIFKYTSYIHTPWSLSNDQIKDLSVFEYRWRWISAHICWKTLSKLCPNGFERKLAEAPGETCAKGILEGTRPEAGCFQSFWVKCKLKYYRMPHKNTWECRTKQIDWSIWLNQDE